MMNRPLGRAGYVFNSSVIIAITAVLAYAAVAGLSFNHHLFSLSIYLGILCVVFGICVLTTQTYRRMRDAAWHPLLLVLLFVPPVNLLLVVFLWFWPSRA